MKSRLIRLARFARIVLPSILSMIIPIALAASAGGGGSFNLGGIETAICNVAGQLTAGKLIGAAGVLAVIAFGWNKMLGESNAFQGIKNVAIGAFFILGAGGLASSVFGSGCSTGSGGG